MVPDSKTLTSIVAALLGAPVAVSRAMEPSAEGGLPDDPGFYAWWVTVGAIPGVPLNAHPEEPSLGLLYVGIAPRDASSSQTVRARVVSNHLRGNTGSSTLRFTLAALLLEELDLHPKKRPAKVVLGKPDNQRLSEWQQTHLRLTWCRCDEPWLLESDVIFAMKPPLNLAGNSENPFHTTLKEARVAFRSAASDAPEEPTGS